MVQFAFPTLFEIMTGKLSVKERKSSWCVQLYAGGERNGKRERGRSYTVQLSARITKELSKFADTEYARPILHEVTKKIAGDRRIKSCGAPTGI